MTDKVSESSTTPEDQSGSPTSPKSPASVKAHRGNDCVVVEVDVNGNNYSVTIDGPVYSQAIEVLMDIVTEKELGFTKSDIWRALGESLVRTK